MVYRVHSMSHSLLSTSKKRIHQGLKSDEDVDVFWDCLGISGGLMGVGEDV